MRNFLPAALAAAALIGGTAQAGVLAYADNGNVIEFTTSTQQAWQLDGSNSTLSFKTAKAGEVVQLSFEGSYCGFYQTSTASAGNQLIETQVWAQFYIDGVLVSGQNISMCISNVLPEAQGFSQVGPGHISQAATVATAGIHTLSVVIGVGIGSTNAILPLFGQTHTQVQN